MGSMLGFSFGQKIKLAVERFSRQDAPEDVLVDRDRLRTTLLQCEFEVRDMHRLLESSPEIGTHRPNLPSCRY